MGIDFLDVVLELETLFGVRLEAYDILPTWNSQMNDCTVRDLHDIVCQKCLASGVKVPRSSWNRVKIALVKSLGVSPSEVTKDAWLRRDLGFYWHVAGCRIRSLDGIFIAYSADIASTIPADI